MLFVNTGRARRLTSFILLLLAILVACSGAETVPQATPQTTVEIAATATGPSSTATPEPSPTPSLARFVVGVEAAPSEIQPPTMESISLGTPAGAATDLSPEIAAMASNARDTIGRTGFAGATIEMITNNGIGDDWRVAFLVKTPGGEALWPQGAMVPSKLQTDGSFTEGQRYSKVTGSEDAYFIWVGQTPILVKSVSSLDNEGGHQAHLWFDASTWEWKPIEGLLFAGDLLAVDDQIFILSPEDGSVNYVGEISGLTAMAINNGVVEAIDAAGVVYWIEGGQLRSESSRDATSVLTQSQIDQMTDAKILESSPTISPDEHRLKEVYGTERLIKSQVLRYGNRIYVTYEDDNGVTLMAVDVQTGERMHAIFGSSKRDIEGNILEGPSVLVLTRQAVADYYKEKYDKEKWLMLNPKYELQESTDMVIEAVTYTIALDEELDNYNLDLRSRSGDALPNSRRLTMQDAAIDEFFINRSEAINAGQVSYGMNGNYINPIVVEADLERPWHNRFVNEAGIHIIQMASPAWHITDFYSDHAIVGGYFTFWLRQQGPFSFNNNSRRVGDPPNRKTYDMTDRVAQAMCETLPSLEGILYLPNYGGVPTSIYPGDHPSDGYEFVEVPEYSDMWADCALVFFSDQ